MHVVIRQDLEAARAASLSLSSFDVEHDGGYLAGGRGILAVRWAPVGPMTVGRGV